MKTIKYGIIGAVALFFAAAGHTFAIENIKLFLQCSNVVLYWPSVEGETYIVQYRPTLDPSTTWQTLASSLPADVGTNLTFFVHSNVVLNPKCNGSGGSFAMMSTGGGLASRALAVSAETEIEEAPSGPLVLPADGTGDAVPLAIYPPGFDLSSLTIIDPTSGESVSGAGYQIQSASLKSAKLGGAQPMGGGIGGFGDPTPQGGSEPTSAPDLAFYRVVREGAQLFGLTNDTVLSGIVSIPVEVGNDSGDLVNLSLTENGSPVGDSIQSTPISHPLTLTVDTTQMSNGVHQISASARWEDTNGGSWEADSTPVSVTVSNEISFPNWMPMFGQLGDSLVIKAQSAHTDTDWYIDVYDSQYSYIGTFGGHTYDGDITVVWNLIGPYGEPHTNDDFFIFYVSTPYIDPVTPPTYKDKDHWTGPGAWVIAAQHAFDDVLGHEDLYDELDGFVTGAQSANYTVLPNSSDGHAFTLHFGADDPQGTYDWAAFRQALYDPRSRNLVYFGHGAPNAIGYNLSNTNRSISATEIANTLHTIPNNLTNRHAFRFVFLDGCSTAKGKLPEAFGIIHKENVPFIDFYNASLIPAAFAGWSAEKYIGFIGQSTVNYDHITFIQNIEWWLANGKGIKEAIDRGATGPFNVSFVYTSELKVFGNWELTFWGYNQ